MAQAQSLLQQAELLAGGDKPGSTSQLFGGENTDPQLQRLLQLIIVGDAIKNQARADNPLEDIDPAAITRNASPGQIRVSGGPIPFIIRPPKPNPAVQIGAIINNLARALKQKKIDAAAKQRTAGIEAAISQLIEGLSKGQQPPVTAPQGLGSTGGI